MPFTAWKHTERNRQRQKKVFAMISRGYVIPVQYQPSAAVKNLDTI